MLERYYRDARRGCPVCSQGSQELQDVLALQDHLALGPATSKEVAIAEGILRTSVAGSLLS
jgi:hypothetical protein